MPAASWQLSTLPWSLFFPTRAAAAWSCRKGAWAASRLLHATCGPHLVEVHVVDANVATSDVRGPRAFGNKRLMPMPFNMPQGEVTLKSPITIVLMSAVMTTFRPTMRFRAQLMKETCNVRANKQGRVMLQSVSACQSKLACM